MRIIYDDDVYGARITAYKEESEEDYEDALCNHLIAKQTQLETEDRDLRCTWSALDFSSDPPTYRTFIAEFDDETAHQEFKDNFYEGKEMAEQSEILEDPDGQYYEQDD